MEIKIDKNVPIKSYNNGKLVSKYPFESMEVGDSFFVEKNPAIYANAVFWAKRSGKDWEFVSRSVEENGKKGKRIWRVK